MKMVRKRSRSVKGKNGVNYEYYTSQTNCEDIQAGDLLILQDNELVPADSIVIKCLNGQSECQV